jgi:hypothetical protein
MIEGLRVFAVRADGRHARAGVGEAASAWPWIGLDAGVG